MIISSNNLQALISKCWASTKDGTKKLNEAFHQCIQMKNDFPIYLFFSINKSSQFCSVAKLLSDSSYQPPSCIKWDSQDKWDGQFKLDWIFVKDIPNKYFKPLKNKLNDYQSVVHSRDVQEVSTEEGYEMLQFFQNFNQETSILDDFDEIIKIQKKLKLNK
ncbi:UNKNOWN [Stylonychia lemnae]|uniref:YTH domain-containing protein n=1 Tax=Stylonychia lemnae TaxID=5949 RepID=A0A078ARS7_STYLE|nr:UNKNOWN [Stylonychia lemnae]|eukprot:CDW83578.1 UNKNOWN [Stylonychia lemnae]